MSTLPVITQSAAPADSRASLLSLSMAAASADPMPMKLAELTPPSEGSFAPGSYNGPSSLPNGGGGVGVNNIATAKLHSAPTKHRRLSSAGMMKRRLSDARDAATRPSCVARIPSSPHIFSGIAYL